MSEREFSLEDDDFFFEFLHPGMNPHKQTFSVRYDFSGHLAKDSMSIAMKKNKGKRISFMKKYKSRLMALLPKVQTIAKDLQNGNISPEEALQQVECLPICCYIFPITTSIVRQVQEGGIVRIRMRQEEELEF